MGLSNWFKRIFGKSQSLRETVPFLDVERGRIVRIPASELRHVRQIQAAFAEHRQLTFEEWEEGFRRDANPEREIAIWSHAADVYITFAGE
jgi:hypothetical protein